MPSGVLGPWPGWVASRNRPKGRGQLRRSTSSLSDPATRSSACPSKRSEQTCCARASAQRRPPRDHQDTRRYTARRGSANRTRSRRGRLTSARLDGQAIITAFQGQGWRPTSPRRGTAAPACSACCAEASAAVRGIDMLTVCSRVIGGRPAEDGSGPGGCSGSNGEPVLGNGLSGEPEQSDDMSLSERRCCLTLPATPSTSLCGALIVACTDGAASRDGRGGTSGGLSVAHARPSSSASTRRS